MCYLKYFVEKTVKSKLTTQNGPMDEEVSSTKTGNCDVETYRHR